MEKLQNLMDAIENKFDCTCRLESDGRTVLLETYSPEGQDVHYECETNIEDNPAETFLEGLKESAANYDPDEEAALWLDSSGHGKNGAPYRMSDLLKDMQWAEQFFNDVARFAQKWMDGKVVEPLYGKLSGRQIKPGDFLIKGSDAVQWMEGVFDGEDGWNIELTANCNVDEVFGTNVETEANEAYLNMYINLGPDLSSFGMSPHISVTYNEDGSPHDYEQSERPLSVYEQSVLLALAQTHAANELLRMAEKTMSRWK